MDEKVCTTCKISKPFFEFHKHVGFKDGYRTICKTCTKLYRNRYVSQNREKIAKRMHIWHIKNKSRVNSRRLLRVYNVTLENFNNTLSKQNNECVGCNKKFDIKNKPVIDHTTNEFRGLLCNNCNLALGNVKDNIHTLFNLIKYLQSSPSANNIS